VPYCALLVVLGPHDLSAKSGVRAGADEVMGVVEVVLELGPHLEVPLPVVRGEGEGVQVAGRVHARTGVPVIPPVASRGVVLVDHEVRNAHQLESLRGDDAGHTRADDQGAEAVGHARSRRRGRLDRTDATAELLGEHHAVALVNVFPYACAEHGARLLGTRHRDRGWLAFLQGIEAPGRGQLDLMLDVLGEPARVVVAETPTAGRAVRRLKPARVTSHLVYHHQQRRNVR
jgi:hypothetical protein